MEDIKTRSGTDAAIEYIRSVITFNVDLPISNFDYKLPSKRLFLFRLGHLLEQSDNIIKHL